ncbi:DUF5131 family protein [Pelagibius litoralis]|uniref:DUF5131 family protein n=1 Tax=Pelagibius litoralis TaxID=374515 RepID=A0A967F0H3_9PROT|nr:DUF5131 family protein [Pelagibius litoralis]NIA70744.1 DUF5131 family protein [Pelagibius litoralis]
MGETTKIGWVRNTDGSKGATINFWIGCTEVSDECDNCYARELSERYGWAEWGAGQPRYKTKGAVKNVRALARKAAARAAKEPGYRTRAFTNSLSDFFDTEIDRAWREEALDEIDAAPFVDLLILTKRPKVAQQVMQERYGNQAPKNIWIGTTAGTQKMWDLRIPILGKTPAAVRFVSVEPMLEGIDPGNAFDPPISDDGFQPVGWVICGGESGTMARTFDVANARALRDQCRWSGVPFFMKQLGARAVDEINGIAGRSLKVDPDVEAIIRRLKNPAGADPTEWPADLRVQQFPEAA